MLISHYGKIIRMDSKTIRESGRNAQGVRLLNMEPGDRVAAAVVLAPEEERPQTEVCCSNCSDCHCVRSLDCAEL